MEQNRPTIRQPIPSHAKRVFKGEIFEVYQWEQVLYDGSTATFEKVKRDDTVAVVASFPNKKFLLLEDEQPGMSSLLTFPGGRMDKGNEQPLEAAKRELLEETGCESSEWELWRTCQPVTKIDWVVYLFIAKNCRKTSDVNLDAGEKITLKEITFDELLEVSQDPRFLGKEIQLELMEARYNPEMRAKLEKTFFG